MISGEVELPQSHFSKEAAFVTTVLLFVSLIFWGQYVNSIMLVPTYPQAFAHEGLLCSS